MTACPQQNFVTRPNFHVFCVLQPEPEISRKHGCRLCVEFRMSNLCRIWSVSLNSKVNLEIRGPRPMSNLCRICVEFRRPVFGSKPDRNFVETDGKHSFGMLPCRIGPIAGSEALICAWGSAEWSADLCVVCGRRWLVLRCAFWAAVACA